jgi:hypothetical protein
MKRMSSKASFADSLDKCVVPTGNSVDWGACVAICAYGARARSVREDEPGVNPLVRLSNRKHSSMRVCS